MYSPPTPITPRHGHRQGVTLIEVVIALTILVLVIINVSMVTKTGSEAARTGAFLTSLDEEANLTLDRISLAIMSSSMDNLYPTPMAPAFTDEVTYSISLGVGAGGETITSDPERISWTERAGLPGRVLWSQNPGLVNERHVVWSNWVPEIFQDEIVNGSDDNDNGLYDETGLSFDMEGNQVNIHLTVERINPHGVPTPTKRRVNVTCRN